MFTLIVTVVFAVVLLAIGRSWVEIGIAIPLFLLVSRGMTLAEVWVERRTGRKSNPKSEAYVATYFLISLGIMLSSQYFFPDLHPIAFSAITMLSITIGSVTAITMFGSQTSGTNGS